MVAEPKRELNMVKSLLDNIVTNLRIEVSAHPHDPVLCARKGSEGARGRWVLGPGCFDPVVRDTSESNVPHEYTLLFVSFGWAWELTLDDALSCI